MPLLCPVCLQVPALRMLHTRDLVALALRCQGCGNAAVLFFHGLIGIQAQEVRPQRA